MVTKSGSNQFHGTAYEFTRSEIFDARNYFSTYSTTPHKPVFRRNQFGGTIGGPIVKDKVFIFGGYEGLRSAQAIPLSRTFPHRGAVGDADVPIFPGASAVLPRAKLHHMLFRTTIP